MSHIFFIIDEKAFFTLNFCLFFKKLENIYFETSSMHINA